MQGVETNYKQRLAEEVKANPFAPLGETIYFILLQDIVFYRYRSGDKIKEAQLAKSFGVSRSPVRWALSMLIQQGLLTKLENSVASVCSYTQCEWEDLLEVRVGLESMAAGQAAVRMSDEDMVRLDNTVHALTESCRACNLEKAYELEQTFHEQIIYGSGNVFLQSAYKALKPHIQRSRVFYTAHSGFYDFFIQEHCMIASILKLRDSVMAEAIMKRHILLLYGNSEGNKDITSSSTPADVFQRK